MIPPEDRSKNLQSKAIFPVPRCRLGLLITGTRGRLSSIARAKYLLDYLTSTVPEKDTWISYWLWLMVIYKLSSPVRSITGPRIIGEVFRSCPAGTAVAADLAGIVFGDDVVVSWLTRLATSIALWLQRLTAKKVPGMEHCLLSASTGTESKGSTPLRAQHIADSPCSPRMLLSIAKIQLYLALHHFSIISMHQDWITFRQRTRASLGARGKGLTSWLALILSWVVHRRLKRAGIYHC